MAAKIPYNTSADALLNPAKDAKFFDQWEAKDFENHDLLCAEMSRLAYAEKEVVVSSLDGIGFTTVDFIGGDDLASRVKTTGTQAFVAKNAARGLTILAFRGTESGSPEDLIADLMTHQTPWLRTGGRVHAGFADRYGRVKDDVAKALDQKVGALLITGHSLGAALATLAAVDTQPAALVTFGSPLVGNREFCKLFDGKMIRRFVDCCDVVARVPPALFDKPHLLSLFKELTDFDPVKDATSAGSDFMRQANEQALEFSAAAISRMFDLVAKDIEFAHVSSPRYIYANGRVSEGISENAIADDQRAARAAYGHRFTVTQLTVFLAEFSNLAGKAFSALPGAFAQHLSQFPGIGRVPSRDLADHAPINYVSAFTGRE
ncbi:MAG: lipase family protein [Pedosphaera sp.]|nr:lipase family protein [Pedosphaera sp.]